MRRALPGGGMSRIAPLLENPRYEVFPAGRVEEAVAEWVPAGMTVTVTASPAKGLGATLDLTERLARRGYHAVPHLSARLVADDAHLAGIVARLQACGVDDVFVPAGDADPPAGRFHSALSLLERLAEMGSPFGRTGITGYPESHPIIGDDVTIQAMWDKRRYATYLVSNLCFDPVTLRRWIERVRARGVTLPLYVGLAGPLDRARLVRMAAKAGASESARFLTRNGSCASAHRAVTARNGCLSAPGRRWPPRHRRSRDCTCTRSTRFSRPSNGAGGCWHGWETGRLSDCCGRAESRQLAGLAVEVGRASVGGVAGGEFACPEPGEASPLQRPPGRDVGLLDIDDSGACFGVPRERQRGELPDRGGTYPPPGQGWISDQVVDAKRCLPAGRAGKAQHLSPVGVVGDQVALDEAGR